jgi:hypothetical protein
MMAGSEPERENRVSVLLRFYTWRVFSRIRPWGTTKKRSAPEKPGQ